MANASSMGMKPVGQDHRRRRWRPRRHWRRRWSWHGERRLLGAAVFFITGRPPELRDATERNLRQAGYQPAAVILLPEGKTFESEVDFKAPERRKLAEQGYTIILNMGDQESDLRGGYAEKTFKLPNPVYFLP